MEVFLCIISFSFYTFMPALCKHNCMNEISLPITIEKTFTAPVNVVWKAITDKDQMKLWYFKLDEFVPETGFHFQFSGEGHKGEKYLHLCQITQVEQESKLAYSWRYKDYPGISFVTFELFPEGEQTRLKLSHDGIETFPSSPDFAKESFAAGWTEIIGTSLKEFVESNNH